MKGVRFEKRGQDYLIDVICKCNCSDMINEMDDSEKATNRHVVRPSEMVGRRIMLKCDRCDRRYEILIERDSDKPKLYHFHVNESEDSKN